ncbi:GTPase Era [Algimonas porphyrae]|uniref:GTPase Era n=1 Tax=Algimonas porphyrae TaxID=1128113 RepID=A0ABQ5UY21_9PROT|nr:GTPase Era [Algimonas porphyrae]GLQ20053.1 GTPase Era [Algimonas porphyrae]
MSASSTTRSGFAAIVGAPNAGKSTLTNRLVGEKVSIVTHKVQTTRFQIRAIALLDTSEGNRAQVVLVDTPGIFAPRKQDRLAKSMVHAAWSGADDANAVVHVVDAGAWYRHNRNEGSAQDRLASEDTERVMAGLSQRERKGVLVLNKIDTIPTEETLPIIAHFDQAGGYERIFVVSATKGDGIDDLATYLADAMPEGPLLYPEDQAADIPMRLMAAEITREKLFLRLHDELPYASMVETEKWTDRKDGSVRIDQIIYVRRGTQKGIVLGKGGTTVKDIGAAARKEMEDWLGRRVHLFIFVKVRENWMDDRARYTEAGLEFDV